MQPESNVEDKWFTAHKQTYYLVNYNYSAS